MIESKELEKSYKLQNLSIDNNSNRIDLHNSKRMLNTKKQRNSYSNYILDINNQDYYVNMKNYNLSFKSRQNKLKDTNKQDNEYLESSHEIFNEKIQLLKTRKNFLEFNFKNYIYYILCKNKFFDQKFQCMEYFSEKFSEKLDLISYFKKMKTLNLIEKLLFQENERYFINLLSNKMFYIDNLNFDETTNEIKKIIKEDKLKKLIDQKNFLIKSGYSKKMIAILGEKI